MKEYSYRRLTFYALRGHDGHPDAHENFAITWDEQTVVEDAVGYLTDGSTYLRFPGAARAVAVAAADFVERHFGEDFYEVLDDPNLMHGNDPYFKRYSEDRPVYDAILRRVPRDLINWESHRMAITLSLITEEYMLDAKGLETLPRGTR